MSDLVFPDGAYFSVIGNVRIGAGGQTRLALLRHRLFSTYAGIELPILTFDPVPSYGPIRDNLLDEGLLLADSVLLNLHEELRDLPMADLPTVEAPPVADAVTQRDDVDDAYHWRRRRVARSGEETAWDYLRTDGSMYARTPPTNVEGSVAIFDQNERPVGAWPSLGGLWRWWTTHLVPKDGPVFLISDSRFIAVELGLLHDPRIHLMHQMHNPHLTGARLWSSPVNETYRHSMDNLARFDGLLSLTARQRDDIAMRYGDTNNLFVVPNPVESAVKLDSVPARRPHSIAMIARLDGQKRIDRAIEAFAMVVAAIPHATLDVYGDGPLRESLQEQIDTAGLAASVTLHGHQPNARERLWSASLLWLTSQFEGYPLSTLEAMSHGVPVVSMDMPYGPREQITDGVDGALVPFGDIEALAHRTIAMLQTDLEPMRAAARAKAGTHGYEKFLTDWQRVIEQVIELKPSRVQTEPTWHIGGSVRGDWIRWQGTLDLNDHAIDDLELSVQAWAPNRTELIPIPTKIWNDGGLAFEGCISRKNLDELLPGAQLRIGFVWRNVAKFIPLQARAPRRNVRSVIGAALRRTGLRRQ